ncbi:MAG: MraY family glycosyltransferase [Porticoccaceae bacterium]
MSNFILSSRELAKLVVMAVFATWLFGLSGLIMILIMQWMTLQSYAEDSVQKHGISEFKASRLGGVALAIGAFISSILFSFSLQVPLSTIDQLGELGPIWLGTFGCFLLGLIEDLWNNRLTPRFRLLCKALILALVFLLMPSLVPDGIGLAGIDWILSFPLFAFVVCLFFSVGFINAVNTVDGANGLVAGIFVISCYILASPLGYFSLSVGVFSGGLFLLFNVVSGRLFLGDAGAYGLGAGMLLIGLAAFAEGVVSLSFLAVLYFYPCFDFLISIVRRYLQGKSITAPDNDHLHNRVHALFKSIFKSKNMANSMTGLSIALGTSGVALVGYLGAFLALTSNLWIFVFMTQAVIYGVVFASLGKTESDANNQALV